MFRISIFADQDSVSPTEVIKLNITPMAAKMRAKRLAAKHQCGVDVHDEDVCEGLSYIGTARPYMFIEGATFSRED